MINQSSCCSEHGASVCFGEHGVLLEMGRRSWFELVDEAVDVLLDRRNHSTWKPEVGTRKRDRRPGGRTLEAGGGNLKLGGRNLEPGLISSWNIFSQHPKEEPHALMCRGWTGNWSPYG
ncbi:hypothetical protein F2Q68_00039143 [Brassica cretica]|uniref:Uncharacterized protein n=1 Tax=Brassica cretica TaxID=69181 RepID=A0A8S9MQP3_BRACR|nr:hypothetical protein F2Q68_00039143 [Brassica cretica]